MSFILGSLLFIVGVGVIDARLPWPKPNTRAAAATAPAAEEARS
jgi:hypothetical protein